MDLVMGLYSLKGLRIKGDRVLLVILRALLGNHTRGG
jgi:hypothetical protein